MRHLYWFRTDLRLEDNPGLLAHVNAEQLLLVYLWPNPRPWCNVSGLGEQRIRFLTESLQALRDELSTLGQQLLILQGSPELVIPQLVEEYGIDEVGTSRTPGFYERKSVEHLRRKLSVPLSLHNGDTLFAEEDLPFELAELPKHFTPFRKRVEDMAAPPPARTPGSLPPPPKFREDRLPPADARPHIALPIRGGSAAARRRVQQFLFDEQRILEYKQTRNCLDAMDGSSTLSPWLANGSLSPRQLAADIHRFEREYRANESTYWLYFELLWREYFHWRAYKDDVRLFRLGRSSGSMYRCTFEPRAFARWCQGDTDFPLVNALMRQLLATGWMSNRGRQIAASCLVNELGLDWRYGAAFFEKHLIDYDVASNYGNWQYLAGVGADPRGGRHFDIDKQMGQHDPEGLFTKKWGGFRPKQQKFVTDAADWPISAD